MTERATSGVRPTFSARREPDGVRIADPIEGVRFDLLTPAPVRPVAAGTDRFAFPVDAAARLDVRAVEVPRLSDVFVRRPDGGLVDRVEGTGERSFPPAEYAVEVTGTELKLYLAVEGGPTVRRDAGSVTVSVDEPPILVGARSLHEQPAGTVTTTDGVRDVMRAISHLGSALKTTSPERSFPTLRGHPPLVEVGDSFDVPAGIEAPDTGVRIEVPPTYAATFAASPLAYYLGARVVPGDRPRLVTAGVEHPLDAPDGYEAEVARVLKGTFLLDCVVRTEGYYRIESAERAALEPALDLDLADCYDRPLDERLAAYLDVPYDLLEPHVPTWKLTTDVHPLAEHVEMLPFIAADLGVVRCPTTPRWTTIRREPVALTEFYRGDETFVRSAGDPDVSVDVVGPEPADSLEQAWVGDGFPIGATKATPDAHRRRLAATANDPDAISVAVVCNDPAMDDEEAVADAFGSREFVDFEVRLHQGLSTREMRSLLTSDVDFLHYVGHVEPAGLRCADGVLDVRTVGSVGVTSFLLNACRSHHQGAALVEAGSVGGIVTLSEVDNHAALTMGRTLARLLNLGFPLASAVSVAREGSYAGSQYLVIGDGGLELVQGHFGAPTVLAAERLGPDRFTLSFQEYPTRRYGPGTFGTPNVGDGVRPSLIGGEVGPFELSASALDDAFDLQTAPIKLDGELHWTDEISAEAL